MENRLDSVRAGRRKKGKMSAQQLGKPGRKKQKIPAGKLPNL